MEPLKQIRILVATGLFAPEIGGPATYARMLQEQLPAHNFAVEILPFSTVRHLPKLIRHAAYFWNVLQKGKKADVIYALDPVSVGLPALCASALLRKRFFVRLGGDYAWEQGQQRFGLAESLDEYTRNRDSAPFMVRVFASIQTCVVRRAVCVVAPSEYLKSIIAAWGVVPEKIQVIYSALFPLEVIASRTQIRERLSYEGQVITTVGRLVPWKGFAELIHVISELRSQEHRDVSLVIVGDGPQQAELQKTIRDLQLEEHVQLLGRLSKDALGPVIRGSDLFVLNTSYEGLSHQLLEVMDLGIPIVTTNVGGNPELITDGVSGLLVAPHDTDNLKKAIVRMLDNESLRTRMVQNARVKLQEFTQEAEVARFAKLLYGIVQPL